jgi:8-oxo-dGTP diphosphatase
MNSWSTRRFRLARMAGKHLTRLVALATLHRMPPFVSTSALVERDGRVLTVFDPIRNEPILPGGHLRWHEPPEDGLVREVWEETGYLVEADGLVDVLAGERWAGEPGVVRIIYRAHIVGGTLRSSPEGEACWHDPVALAESESRDAEIIRRWRQRGQDDST